MQWCLKRTGQPSLELVTANQADLDQVNSAYLALSQSGVSEAQRFAEELDSAILDGRITPGFLALLGEWCNVGGPNGAFMEQARSAGQVMLGCIVPQPDCQTPLTEWLIRFALNAGMRHCPKGSWLCLKRYVNEAPQELSDLLIGHSPSLSSFGTVRLDWHSPLEAQDYYEYRDDFLQPLGLSALDHERQQFWPAGGPQWDALASVFGPADNKGCLLVEAKANLAETRSNCGAVNPASIAQIRRAFATVQAFMGVVQGVTPETWMQGHYQMANRLAFLYLMNELLKVPTWLAFVSFLDDNTHLPTSLGEWRPHQVAMFRHLGLHPGCRLLDRVVTLFTRPLPSGDE